jgi:hypothetical protein
MPVALSIKAEGFKEAELALAGINGAYPAVAARAINRSLVTGRKVIAQAIGARYNIKAADVKNNIDDHKASKSNLAGELEIRGEMLPITLFKPSGGQVLKSGKRKAIKAAVRRNASKEIRSAFRVPGGKIMERRQDDRLPIFPVSTISVAHMAGQTGVSEKVETEMVRTAADRLKHETNRMLEQKGFK